MKKTNVIIFFISVILLIGTVVVAFMINRTSEEKNIRKNVAKQDDWAYTESNSDDEYSRGTYNKKISSIQTESVMDSDSTIGFSTGGAKDINNFRENINNGYFPLISDITYEGIYYDYYFDTGSETQKEDKLFYATATTAVSKDPISNNEEYFVSVGLNSNIKEEDFQRKKLNLVVVLDISGSMSSGINSYYYNLEQTKKESKTKMKLAEEAVNVLIDQLNEDDSFGMVLFDDSAYIAKPLNKVGNTDMDAIKEHILEIKARGGTNFEKGYQKAQTLFNEYGTFESDEYENRIIVITDAMPNIGTTDKSGLLQYIKSSADSKIYTTFIGVGVDFNTEVIKAITNVKGANYYSVSNEEDFKKRMGEEFEYMVTPIIFDLNLEFNSDSFKLEKIYGTDDIDSENSDSIMHVNTLFPSASNSSGEVKGGVVLLKLKRINKNTDEFELKVSYEKRNGAKENNTKLITFKDEEEYYDNTGIRKAIVLARYVNLIKDWTTYERSKDDRFLITPRIGIIDWYDVETKGKVSDYGYYSENERVSVDLTVSNEYKEVFLKFKEYMKNEIEELNDSTMKQEMEILDIITK